MARNIVLIGSDSIRADHCSCYGYHRETTPFIDAIAKEGVKFENPVVSGLATPASFMGIFTGDYSPLEANLITPQGWNNAIKQRTTLAQVLSEKGYHTYGFNTNAMLSRYYGFNKGFQHYFDGLWTVKGKHGWWWNFKKFHALPFLKKRGVARHAVSLKNFLKSDIGYMRTEGWIANVLDLQLEEPYFLWVFLVDTHHPYVPPKEYAKWGEIGTRRMIYLNHKMRRQGKGEVVAEASYKGNRSDRDQTAEGESRWILAQQKLQPKLNRKERETIINGYDGEILHVDSIVHRLWKHLEQTNPVFIFHSDHGDGLGEHGFYGHPPEHYEYLIKVPLVIYNTGRNGVIERPVSFLRLAATICELAGVENEFNHPSLFNEEFDSPPIVENRIDDMLRVTIRTSDWKLITNPDREDELYNIRQDPYERENMIKKEGSVANELRGLIQRHKKMRAQGDERTKIANRIRSLKSLEQI